MPGLERTYVGGVVKAVLTNTLAIISLQAAGSAVNGVGDSLLDLVPGGFGVDRSSSDAPDVHITLNWIKMSIHRRHVKKPCTDCPTIHITCLCSHLLTTNFDHARIGICESRFSVP